MAAKLPVDTSIWARMTGKLPVGTTIGARLAESRWWPGIVVRAELTIASSSARRKSDEGKQGAGDEVRRADSSDDSGAVRADRPRPPWASFASSRESVCAVPDVQREDKTDDGEGYRAKPHAVGRHITALPGAPPDI